MYSPNTKTQYIINSTFVNCSAYEGGAIIIYGGGIEFLNVTFSGNKANIGSDIYLVA